MKPLTKRQREVLRFISLGLARRLEVPIPGRPNGVVKGEVPRTIEDGLKWVGVTDIVYRLRAAKLIKRQIKDVRHTPSALVTYDPWEVTEAGKALL